MAAIKPSELLKRFRIDSPKRFRLAAHDCAETCGLDMNKDEAKAAIAADVARLEGLQERLYADDRWALLVVMQGMDAAGKDSAIKHVMSGINPQGCEVTSFKAPSSRGTRSRFSLAPRGASAARRPDRNFQPLLL